jgi:hypothetical protein
VQVIDNAPAQDFEALARVTHFGHACFVSSWILRFTGEQALSGAAVNLGEARALKGAG